MQLSTRGEDVVVDAMALRSHIGPLLGPIFVDPGVRRHCSWVAAAIGLADFTLCSGR